MRSMDSLKNAGRELQSSMKEKVGLAEEMRAEIDRLKQGMEGMPDGLDDSVQNAIESATNEARENALREITEQEERVNEDRSRGEGIVGEIGAKKASNETAARKLDALRGNQYGTGIESTLTAIRENTNIGEEAEAALNQEMDESAQRMRELKSGI